MFVKNLYGVKKKIEKLVSKKAKITIASTGKSNQEFANS